MASAALSDNLLRLVLWLSIALFALMLALLLQIALLRIRLIARTAREQRFMEIWRPQMTAASIGSPYTFPPLRKGDEFFFLKLWNHLHGSLRGDATARLNTLAAHYGMWQYAHTLLHHRQLGVRLLGLNTLGKLKNRAAWPDILRLTMEPDPLLSLAAVRALFLIDPDAALKELKQSLLVHEDWSPSQLAILIQQASSDASISELTNTALDLSRSVDPTDLGKLRRLLHLLEVAPHQKVIPAIRALLVTSNDDEVVAQCLKFLRDPADIASVQKHLGHPNWLVRMQAASALERLGTARDLPQLATLLADPVWWVRFHAAQAMVTLTHGDPGALAELRERVTDRYGRDMLKMVMEAKGAS